MALNVQTFKTRALTALVFVIVMMTGLLWNQWSFFLLFSIVHFGAWHEYQQLVSAFNPDYTKISAAHRFTVRLGGWCLMLYFTNEVLQAVGVSLTTIGFWGGIAFMLLLPIIMLLDKRHIFLRNILYSLTGLLYISLPLALLTDIRTTPGDDHLAFVLPLAIIFSIWINDTMAYIVGSFIGKTPLSVISPKKTWEGTIGGIILTIVVMGVLAYTTGELNVFPAMTIAGIAAITGTFGDLFESKLKRMAGVKDSGSFMPGHGGFLDRFDSLLFASLFVWFFVKLYY